MAIPFKKYGYQVNPITDEIETPKIFLVDRKLNKLGQLYPVDNLHITLNEVNQADEISFTYYKQTDGVDCPCFDQLDNLFIIQVEKFGFFEVAVNKEDSTTVQKSVSGISLGFAELSQILTSVEINTDDDMNRDDYDRDYPTVFYREISGSPEIAEKKRESSLLHRVLKRAPHYKIGTVSDTLKYVQRTFSWSDQDIISIFNDIAQEINCVFDVHVSINEDGQVERIVNAYDVQYCDDCYNKLSNEQKEVSSNVSQFRNIVGGVCQHCGLSDYIYDIGENTNIFISTDSLSDDITIECDKDSIKNSFKIVGGDDLITNTVTGLSMSASDRIMLFSDYQKEQMSAELKQVYENYIADYNANKTNYARLLQTQYNIYDIIQYLQSGKMPMLEEEIKTTDMALYSTIEKIFTYYNNTFYISQWSYYESFNSSYNSVRNLFTTFLPKGYFFTVDEDDKVVTETYDSNTDYLWYGTIKFYRTNDQDDYYELHVTKSGTNITHGKNKDSFRFEDKGKQDLIDSFRIQFAFGDKSQAYMEYIRQHTAYILGNEVDLTYDNEKARHWEDYGLNPLNNYYSGFTSCIESLEMVLCEEREDNVPKNLLIEMQGTYKKIQSDIAKQIKVLEKQIFALCYYLGDFSSATNYVNEDGTISSQFQSLITEIPDIFANMVDSHRKGGYSKNIVGLTTVYMHYEPNEYIGDMPIKCKSCNSSFVSMTANGAICNNKNCGSTDIYTYADMMKEVIDEYKSTNHQIISELKQQYHDQFDLKRYINNFKFEPGKEINRDELYNELFSFIREDVYSNSNYISDGLTNAQLIEETQALITKAQQELAKACVPQYTITTPLCSIVAQTAFEYKGVLVNDDYSGFMINNYVHVKIDKEIHTMRISSIDLEFPITDRISVTFTNATKGTGIMNDIASVLSNAANMATSFNAVATQAEKGNQANSTFETIKSEGLNAALMSVKGGGTEQDVIIDEHGILLRRKIFETGEYSDCQMKLINRNIVLTKDNWKTAELAIGYGLYTVDGEQTAVYGVWADLLVGDLIVGKEIKIYGGGDGTTDNATVIIDGKGITLDGGAITWKKKLPVSSVDGLDTTLGTFVEKTLYDQDIKEIQSQIDGNITTWFYDHVPDNGNEPAVNWKDDDNKKIAHEGDLFYCTDPNNAHAYRYVYDKESKSHKWILIKDTDVTKALADASRAQDTADNKRRVFVAEPIPPYDEGDLWVQGETENGEIMRCKVPRQLGETYSVSSDWIKASKYTDDTKALEVEDSLESYKTEINNFKTKIDSTLSVTEIGEDYVISPKIGGGYLYITSGNYSVEIDPNHKAGKNTKNNYLFCIRNKEDDEIIMGVTTGGSGHFKGKITATSGYIGGENGNGWIILQDRLETRNNASIYQYSATENGSPAMRIVDGTAIFGSRGTKMYGYFDDSIRTTISRNGICINENENCVFEANTIDKKVAIGSNLYLSRNMFLDGNYYLYSSLMVDNVNINMIGMSNSKNLYLGMYYYNNSHHPDYVNSIILSASTTEILGTLKTPDGTVVKSDARFKTDVENVKNKEIDFILGLSPKKYKLKEGTSRRYHYGFIAQDVEKVMNDTIGDAGLLVKSEIKPSDDPNYVPIDFNNDSTFKYGLRYEEFIAPMVKTIQMMNNEIKDLKEELELLKEKIAKN